MILDYKNITEYIIKNYKNEVVEVGGGSLPQAAGNPPGWVIHLMKGLNYSPNY